MAQTAAPPGAWISLFDGKPLDAWKETQFTGRGAVLVKDGTVVLRKGRLTGITWTREFPRSGYEIRFEAARIEGNNFFALKLLFAAQGGESGGFHFGNALKKEHDGEVLA